MRRLLISSGLWFALTRESFDASSQDHPRLTTIPPAARTARRPRHDCNQFSSDDTLLDGSVHIAGLARLADYAAHRLQYRYWCPASGTRPPVIAAFDSEHAHQ
jgi:hypothetical protein